MNKRPKRTFVKAVTGCGIEPAQAGFTGGANTEIVQSKPVRERCVAIAAKIIGFEGDWRVEALVTNRNPRPSRKRTLADAAVIGEK